MKMAMGLSVAAIVACAGSAMAQSLVNEVNGVTLFGQAYRVQRFNYGTDVQIPDLRNLGGFIAPIEAEGTTFFGRDGRGVAQILLSTRDGDNTIFNPVSFDHYIVAVDLNTDVDGNITGIAWNRTLVVTDSALLASNTPWTAAPRGLTINTGTTGLGAGGNIVVSRARAFAFSTTAANPAVSLIPGGDFAMSPNANNEDMAFVASRNEFWSVWQPASRIVRHTTTGTFAGDFVFSGARDLSLVANNGKGITFVPAGAANMPPALQGPNGVVIVGLDDLQPGLEVYRVGVGADPASTFVAREKLTTDDIGGGDGSNSLLDMNACGLPLQIESLTVDPVTGRIFLTNQGDNFDCNWLFILTPVVGTSCPACPADFDGNGEIEPIDVRAFFTAFRDENACADIDGNGELEPLDVRAFFGIFRNPGTDPDCPA
jgi:hypothetical protein